MDSELNERLAVLETLLEALKENTSSQYSDIIEKINNLQCSLDKKYLELNSRVKDLELWRAEQRPIVAVIKLIISSLIGSGIVLILTVLVGSSLI
jgi:uncharacterized coiled-coil protein SlyX